MSSEQKTRSPNKDVRRNSHFAATLHAAALMRAARRSSILVPAESRTKFRDLKQRKSSWMHSGGEAPWSVQSLGGFDVE